MVSGFSRWVFLFGMAAASVCARDASAQDEMSPEVMSKYLSLPPGGLQISCVGHGDTTRVDFVSFYFEKRVHTDTLFDITAIVYDRIGIDPDKNTLEFTPATFINKDPETDQLFAFHRPWKTVDFEKDSTLAVETRNMLQISKEFCRKRSASAHDNVPLIMPVDMIANPAAQAARRIKEFFGY